MSITEQEQDDELGRLIRRLANSASRVKKAYFGNRWGEVNHFLDRTDQCLEQIDILLAKDKGDEQ